jgi:glycosyltransferase A (GT-A) superfamily protein (DUF2064 family)
MGPAAAAKIYRTTVAHTLRRLGWSPRWRTFLAITPDADKTARLWSQMAPSQGIGRLSQGEGDLGRRMQRLFECLPPGPAIIIGSDIPSVRPCHIAEAFRLLAAHDAVLGPAHDGGFWLIGLRRSPRLLAPFSGVRWSSLHALADILANLQGHRVALVATLGDIDTEDDYRRIRQAAQRLVLSVGK